MKILLASVGTRGDIVPFLAIGHLLSEQGHEVVCAFPEQFRHLTRGSSMRFASLGSGFLDMLESDDGKAALGSDGSGMRTMVAYARLAGKSTQVNKDLLFCQKEIIDREAPDSSLTEFLNRHDNILFVTFGSMTNPDPVQKTATILDVLSRNRIPAIIATASGGLVKPERYDTELIQVVSHIPYAWIFQKVYAVMHHGGSGTMHAALKNGCATMIISHILDQFVWDRIVSESGVGPQGIRIDRMTPQNLEPKVLELLTNGSFKKRAQELGEQMSREDFKQELANAILE